MSTRRRRDRADVEENPRRKRKRIESSDEEVTEKENDVEESSDESDQSMDTDEEEQQPVRRQKPGSILRIHLRNFMCHANLAIDFNSKINLLVGVNGSGKSAIITALAIGLGAKASVTNRSQNLKSFINRDATSASIEIHLSNDGPDAYRDEKYDGRLIIKRTITQTGGSYSIKDSSGKMRPIKRNDLSRILHSLNIQVDNPIVLLNQDAARTFLKDAEPKQLYKLFLKATQIDVVIDKLEECTMHIHSAKASLGSKKKAFSAKEKEKQALELRYDALKSLDTLKAQQEELKTECAWAKVKELEPGIKEKKKAMEDLTVQISETAKLIQNKDNLDAEINVILKELDAQITEKQQSLAPADAKMNKMKEDINNIDADILKLDRTITRVETLRTRKVKNIQEINQSIKESTNQDVFLLRQKNQEDLSRLQAEKDDNSTSIQTNVRDITLMRSTLADSEDSLEVLKNKRIAISQAMKSHETQLQSLRQSKNDSLSAYGSYMSNLVQRIEQEYQRGKFSEQPRGPLGRYVQVPDTKWRNTIDQVCGRFLTSFFVNNDRDRTTLSNLIKREFPGVPMPQITTSEFCKQVYDISRGMVQRQNSTIVMIQAMKISDPVVMNCFIDQMKIETILLTEEADIAASLTDNVEAVPDNLSKVVLRDPPSEYYPQPNYRTYSMNTGNRRYIEVSSDELQQKMEEEIKKGKANLTNINDEIAKLEHQIKKYNETLQGMDRNGSLLSRKRRELDEEINKIKNFEYPAENSTEVLNNELEENRKELNELDSILEEHRQNSEGMRERLQKLHDTYVQLKEEKRGIEREITAIQGKIGVERNRLYQLVSDNRMREAQRERYRAQAEIAAKEYEVVYNQYKEESENAEKVGPRCAVKRTRAELTKDIQKTEARIKQLSSSKENTSELQTRIKTIDEELQKLRHVMDRLKVTTKFLFECRQGRYNHLRQMKTQMASRIGCKFRQILKIKNFTGNIEFDWQAEALRLKINPRGLETAQETNTKSLSGGERSFSTVALLISLWSCIDHPFYFLDEYDVFTDQVNRYIMTSLLIQSAEEKGDQFAFLTPQDMSRFRARDNLTIHHFEDPLRC